MTPHEHGLSYHFFISLIPVQQILNEHFVKLNWTTGTLIIVFLSTAMAEGWGASCTGESAFLYDLEWKECICNPFLACEQWGFWSRYKQFRKGRNAPEAGQHLGINSLNASGSLKTGNVSFTCRPNESWPHLQEWCLSHILDYTSAESPTGVPT